METLEERDWPGKYIPVVPVYGGRIVHLTGKSNQVRLGALRKRSAEDVRLLADEHDRGDRPGAKSQVAAGRGSGRGPRERVGSG